MELNEKKPGYRDEYSWIKSYFDGEVDFEFLVAELGEDMARGVRIAEKYLKEENENEKYVLNIVSDDIKNNGKIAQTIKDVYGAERLGEISRGN